MSWTVRALYVIDWYFIHYSSARHGANDSWKSECTSFAHLVGGESRTSGITMLISPR